MQLEEDVRKVLDAHRRVSVAADSAPVQRLCRCNLSPARALKQGIENRMEDPV
jgi:hypothetical protein